MKGSSKERLEIMKGKTNIQSTLREHYYPHARDFLPIFGIGSYAYRASQINRESNIPEKMAQLGMMIYQTAWISSISTGMVIGALYLENLVL